MRARGIIVKYKYRKIQRPRFREITSLLYYYVSLPLPLYYYVSLPDNERVIYMARLFSHRRKYIACSSQDLFAYSESLQHPTIAILLIQILNYFRPLGSVHLLQSNQRFQAIEFVNRHVSEKL